MCVGRCAQRDAMSVHFFVIADNSDTSRFLWTLAMRFSQYHEDFLQVLHASMSAKQPRADHGNISKQNGLPQCARPHGPRVSAEWVATCSRDAHVTVGMHSVDLAKCMDTHGLLQRHILGDAVLSDFSGSHTGGELNRCRRAKQYGGPYTLQRRSYARHCCLLVELLIQFRIFRDLSFQVEKWVQCRFTSCRCLTQQK